jgi:hypothetical protein
MSRLFRLAISLAASAVLSVTAGGCGSAESVVHIAGASDVSISKPTLDHWMRAMVGGDFRQSLGTRGPTGLASEPADRERCLAAVKLVAPRSFFNQLKQSRAELEKVCRELHRSVEAQALSFLIATRWAEVEAAELGITVTDADVRQLFAGFRKHLYPTERDLHDYLAERQWSLADVLYQFRRDALNSKVALRVEQKLKRSGGGAQAFAKFSLKHYSDLVARTSCEPGYVVPNCSQYRGPSSVSPSPDVILKNLAGRPMKALKG